MKLILTTLGLITISKITAQIVKDPRNAKQFLSSQKMRLKRGFFDLATSQPTTLAPGQTTTTRSHDQQVRDQAEAFAEKYKEVFSKCGFLAEKVIFVKKKSFWVDFF